jgi:hypothetical protein
MERKVCSIKKPVELDGYRLLRSHPHPEWVRGFFN